MTPARILRAKARDRDPHPIHFTSRQIQRQERILAIGQYLLAEEGRHNITFSSLAIALQIGTVALRFHYADLDALLGDLLRRHLMKLSTAMGEIAPDAPDRQQARRAAYLAYTRRPFGGLTEAHLLLVRDRHLLPPDELESIELMRQGLGDLLAGDLAEEALLLLDSPALDENRIEARLITKPEPVHPAHPKTPLPPLREREGPTAKRWEGEGLAASETRKLKQAAITTTAPPPRTRLTPIQVTLPPDPPDPEEKPGDWIFSAGIPGITRPKNASPASERGRDSPRNGETAREQSRLP